MTKRTPSKRRQNIYAAIVAAIVLLIGGFYANYRMELRPVSQTGEAVEFSVRAGENAPTIAQKLVDQKLLRSRSAFVTYVNLHGLRPRLKAGTYLLAPTMPGDEIANLLAGGRTTSKQITVPEGYTISQIETAAEKVGISKAAFAAALAAPHTQSFLSGRPAGAGLEGYLFPDSYDVSATTSATTLVDRMLDTFGERIGTEYNQAFAAQGLNLHQAVIMASIVEREVSIPADRPIVAQIFLKRYRIGMPLGSDATSCYVYIIQTGATRCNDNAAIAIDSPYNTRKVAGLPPTPISNPGLSSFDAVANPATTDYLYFLSGRDGKTYYGKTYAEHQANIDKHL